MREVSIVTDSTADLPPESLLEHGIRSVPLVVALEGESYPDGSFTQEEYFARMAELEVLPKTSQPSVGAFEEAYRRALEKAREVVSLHVSSKLSGTVQSAKDAAQRFGDRVHVFDSKSVSGGLGLVTLAAARVTAAGGSVREVLAAAERTRDRVRVIVALDGIENLAKGGRIGKLTSYMGSRLSIRPLLEVVDGSFEPAGRVRNAQGQLRKLLDYVSEQMGERTGGTFVVLHALAQDRARTLRDEIVSRFKPDDVTILPAGTVISTHTGTGIGIAFTRSGT